MNPLQSIATLRKFGNYLAGLFPILVAIGDFFTSRFKKILEHPALAPIVKKIQDNPSAQSLWKFIERFYWRTYSKDRLDLQEAHPESVGVLKPILQLLALLCVLIPLTQIPLNPILIETFSGFKGNADSWSVMLWILTLPCAWAALLVGAGVSNRITFAAAGMGAAFFLSTCVITLPRNYSNALLGAAVIVALAFCERTLKPKGKSNLAMPILNSVVVGACAGVQMFILTPLKPFIATMVNLPGPVLGIGGGALGGIIIGILTLVWARLPENKRRPLFFRGGTPGMGTMVWTIALMLLVYLCAAVARGGLSQTGGLLMSSLAMSNNYLWPIWYFIGVGIIHKLLSSSKTIASATEGLLPKKLLAPLLVLALIACVGIALSEKASIFLSTQTGPLSNTLLPVVYQVYRSTKPYIWGNPLNVMTVHWLTWVFVFDITVITTLALQRKLTNAALTRLFFITVFAALLLSEYVFQLSSFARSPKQSVTALFFFSVWLLWLMHTIGWGLSIKSSPLWPSKGRLAVYCGIATLAILDIHSRAACKDFKLTNELFLTMFRGVIDVGLPYYFLVWTSKKVTDLPVKIPTLLGLFSLGAVTSLTFNAFEKLACAHWLFSGLARIVDAQLSSLKTAGSINIDVIVPPSWLVVRAIIYVAILIGLSYFVRAKPGVKTQAANTALISLVAFASGIASFSMSFLELPMPNEVRALTAPLTQELMFNCNLLQSFLSYWIPALMLGLVQFSTHRRRLFLYPIIGIIAGLSHFYISLSYVQYLSFMRATGILYPVMTMFTGLFVILVAVALTKMKQSEDQLEAVLNEETSESAETFEPVKSDKSTEKSNLLTPRSVIFLVVLTEILILPFVTTKALSAFESRPIQALHHRLMLPHSWHEQSPTPGVSPFLVSVMKKDSATDGSTLQMAVVKSDPQGIRALLRTVLTSAIQSKRFENFTLISAESWNRYAPNALSCKFGFQSSKNGMPVTNAGLVVLVPIAGDKTECYSLYGNPTDIDSEQWELAYALEQLTAAAGGTARP